MKTDKSTFFRTAAAVLVLAAAFAAAGCKSVSNPTPANLALLTYTNRTMADVQAAVSAGFAEHGFSGGQDGPNHFTFSRPGTRLNQLGTDSNPFPEPVSVKVEVTTTQMANNIFVGFNAWLLETADTPMFMEPYKSRQLRKWPFDQLLKDIQSKLGP
jgi:hypothetical protein